MSVFQTFSRMPVCVCKGVFGTYLFNDFIPAILSIDKDIK